MRVVHEPTDGDRQVLASNVETADSALDQLLGLRFRRALPDDYALVFEFDRVRWGLTDMLFVPIPLDVVWFRNREVVRVETLAPWRGLALVASDGFVEFPVGTAAAVEPGDRLLIGDADTTDSGSSDGPAGRGATDPP